MAATFRPCSLSMAAMRRVVWLLPDPVLTAHTEITGFVLLSIVSAAPRILKLAPAELAIEPRSITYV